MNGTMYGHDPSIGFYTGNGPMHSSYVNYYPTTFTPNSHIHQLYQAVRQDNIKSQQQTFNPLSTKSNNSNQYGSDIQHQFYPNNPPQQITNPNVYNFENGGLASIAYYDNIRARVRSNPVTNQHQSSISTNSSIQYPYTQSPSMQQTPTTVNSQADPNFLVVPGAQTNRSSSPLQSSTGIALPVPDQSQSIQNMTESELSLDFPEYSMDALIQRLVPTDTYIPKQSFIYPMLLCSRMNIRPSLLFNQLARLTIKSIANMTHDRSIRTMNNFLYVLSQWTRTFPYDFRNSEMMLQLEDLFKKITSFESTLQSDIQHIYKKLRSKLKALDHYEDYIRQLNKKAMYNLTQLALVTDIMNECPTSILFAQQLTHIELDRLKPVGAEELIQYFIMKLASEEIRAHPNRNYNTDASASDGETPNHKSQKLVHDKKLTFCLEAYIQWFNRLTFFITTEIVKHTQRRSRVRLINYFIDTAYECFRLQNFNSMIGILGGLNMQPVRRLRKTWEKIQLDKFQQLEQYMDVSKNFATYRLVLKVAMEEAEKHGWVTNKIVIPFTSIILQDVYYIKTHSKDHTPAGGINLKKYYSMAKFISEDFVLCKQSKCSFERSDEIINYIITSPTFNEDSLMLASFECEPPATVTEKEKHRALQKSVNTS
ncbi:unnamed protein product [Adineta steineri]|uniref:Ras guanine nucleotide exchange factor n=1 Tax=Adineta steineri TaxID=433720 RepID=A0A818YWG2_9BILA|nr:unnamed protein product [Adineta steineri]CAF3712848.1 unnamed protein product [Adineta steineri]CAF3760432.1 unnamed protein product [Adineta steineri]